MTSNFSLHTAQWGSGRFVSRVAFELDDGLMVFQRAYLGHLLESRCAARCGCELLLQAH
ncbi:hypothetical protein [Streptomyces indicus]|uniref:hypothetical protein n=1 Tax=Streptomyces indicus TaxID=417292 RepID=UPI0015A0BF45|nr:hypothetical protein [Streptomyces indicus]